MYWINPAVELRIDVISWILTLIFASVMFFAEPFGALAWWQSALVYLIGLILCRIVAAVLVAFFPPPQASDSPQG